jgi:hypothetical protein
MGNEDIIVNSGNIVLATEETSFISKCIRWFTQSQFSHSFVTMPDVLSLPMCIEAVAAGVDYVRFDSEYSNNISASYQMWSIKIDQNTKDMAMQSILKDLEIEYGVLQYAYFIWRKINSLLGKDIKSQNNWFNQGMICSQLCVAYLAACGLENIFIGYGKGSISPQDLFVIFNAHPELFELVQSTRMPA